MSKTSNRNPGPRRCKIKAVNPPFRSVSTPRSTKDLPNLGPVNSEGALGRLSETPLAPDWNAERLCERLRFELEPGAWGRLVQAAERGRATLEQLLETSLPEVA
jgi:hypothetical protein